MVEKKPQIQESFATLSISEPSTLKNSPNNAIPEDIEKLIIDTFPENPELMLKVAYCESRLKQYDDNGEVIHSPTDDWGVMQIHRPLWEKKAEELGYNIYSTAGNIKMARYIYDIQGVTAWSCYKIIR